MLLPSGLLEVQTTLIIIMMINSDHVTFSCFKHFNPSQTHLVCLGCSWLDRWSRAGGGTWTRSRDGGRGLGRLFDFAARLLLLLLLLGLSTRSLLLGLLPVLLLLLLGDVLEAGLDASCAAAS